MPFDAHAPFERRLAALPRLGLGISTEFGASAGGLDLIALREAMPERVRFLEIGADLERGLDDDARRWIVRGWPTTLHFLDLNLEEREDLDPAWIAGFAALAREVRAGWLCGDAGLWHVGPRERGHGALMPPILTLDSAYELADNVRALRQASGYEVLPENPPAHVYLGDLHILDYFARVAEQADSGLLLDVAHLAIYQHVQGLDPLIALDGYPLERVVEIHVAGGSPFRSEGRIFIDDDHSPEPLEATWRILEYVLPRARNLRALVYECERNRVEQVRPGFERLADLLGSSAPA